MAYRPIGEGIIESYGSLQDDTGMLLINSSHEVQPQLGSLITDIPTHQPEWDENESGTFQGGWTDQSPNSFMNVEVSNPLSFITCVTWVVPLDPSNRQRYFWR
jgi:hypothetical protein